MYLRHLLEDGAIGVDEEGVTVRCTSVGYIAEYERNGYACGSSHDLSVNCLVETFERPGTLTEIGYAHFDPAYRTAEATRWPDYCGPIPDFTGDLS